MFFQGCRKLIFSLGRNVEFGQLLVSPWNKDTISTIVCGCIWELQTKILHIFLEVLSPWQDVKLILVEHVINLEFKFGILNPMINSMINAQQQRLKA